MTKDQKMQAVYECGRAWKSLLLLRDTLPNDVLLGASVEMARCHNKAARLAEDVLDLTIELVTIVSAGV